MADVGCGLGASTRIMAEHYPASTFLGIDYHADSVAAARGSISAEHGLGRTKAAAGASYKSEVEVDLMRALKRALDPDGLMNPGVLLPPP